MTQWIYRNYVWAGLVAAAGALFYSTYMNWIDEPYVVGGIVAFIISTFLLIQQQRLEATRLFKELFSSFNERYDKYNDTLAAIDGNKSLEGTERDTLIDYFNLCAEEFLFYRQGYIHREVWRAWCRGMQQYLQRPAIKELWRKEEATGSYYGLTLDVINAGAED